MNERTRKADEQAGTGRASERVDGPGWDGRRALPAACRGHGRWLGGLLVVAAVLVGAGPAGAADEVPRRQIGQLVLEGVPDWDEALRTRMVQYLNARSAGLADLRDDGQAALIATRFGNTAQLHLVHQPLGMRQQITFFDEPVTNAAFVPGTRGQRIIFAKDQDGNERSQLYLLDLVTGRTQRLTDGQGRVSSMVLSRDGKQLAFSSTARNERDFDVYVLDLTGTEPARRVWEVEGNYYPSSFSPDGTRLLVGRFLSASESQWFVLDLASGAQSPITPESPPASYGGGVWSHDGNAVYLTSDRDGEFRKLYLVDFNYGQWQCLTPDIEWDVTGVAVEPTGKGLAFLTNEDGSSRLYFAGPHGKDRRAVEGLPVGTIGGLTFAAAGGVLGVAVNSARSPSDVYLISYPAGAATRWTQSEVGGLDTTQFVEPRLIRYPTFDEVDGRPRQIPAFYYPAPQPGKRPVVIYAHGGPESQFRPVFTSLFQYWALELGISVIAPNIRGSTGYGRTFHQLDDGPLREDSIRDIAALLDWIAQQPELDGERVGIFGGSYGGYVVLASLANYPERFRAGVCSVGIANFLTFLENTGDYRRDLRRREYGDERDPEMRALLERISPLNNAHRITAALFVLHGQNDPRVPVGEAEQIVAKLRELQRPVWYALGLNEGHGFAKKENADLARILYAVFWQEHLAR